jgi:hypothetical protein
MRFIAAIDTTFFGVSYAQGSDVNTTNWTKRQILQHLDLGLIAPSQISSGQIADALKFDGDGVTTVVDINGRTIVTISMLPQVINWLLDVDTESAPPDDGAALVWDAGVEQWVPGTPTGGGGGGGGTLDSLTDVDVSTDPPGDGATLLYDALTGQWIPGSVVAANLDDLTDVDVTTSPPTDNEALVWDSTLGKWVPGSASSTPGPPGPTSWGIPTPWSSASSYVTGPPASVVTYNGSAYVAILPGANHQPDVSTTFWRLIVSKGAQGDVGPASTVPGPPGPANTLSIGTVSAGTAAATITGTAPTQTLNLVLPPGATGADGRTVLSTSGIPSNATGLNGDFAYDAASKVMYGPKAAGVWPAGVSLAGSAGANGKGGVNNTMSWVGTLIVTTTSPRLYYDGGGTLTIAKIRLSVQTPSVGADIIVDVLKNGTTIFPTTARPKIVAAASTGTAVPDITNWGDGDYLQFIVTQVGTTYAGFTLTATAAIA